MYNNALLGAGDAMSDLRKAAEALINHWEAGEFQNCTGDMAGHIRLLRQALAMENFSEVNQEIEQALAQPEQEPKIKHSLSFCKSIQSRVYIGDEMVSLAKMTLEEAGLMPKREWVGLTVEEVLELLPSSEWKADVTLIFAKAIEAKLKEKNSV